jgi:hypothetical protein
VAVMKPALISIIFTTLLSYSAAGQNNAQKPDRERKPDAAADETRRLDSVTWDLKSQTLSWTVQKGTEVDGEFVPTSAEHYEITPDVATMTVHDEKRGFEPDEAALLHRLLDTISVYCAQSVIWWDNGEGEPLTGDADRAMPDEKKLAPKDDKPQQNKKPAAKPPSNSDKRPPLGVAEVFAHPVRPER